MNIYINLRNGRFNTNCYARNPFLSMLSPIFHAENCFLTNPDSPTYSLPTVRYYTNVVFYHYLVMFPNHIHSIRT